MCTKPELFKDKPYFFPLLTNSQVLKKGCTQTHAAPRWAGSNHIRARWYATDGPVRGRAAQNLLTAGICFYSLQPFSCALRPYQRRRPMLCLIWLPWALTPVTWPYCTVGGWGGGNEDKILESRVMNTLCIHTRLCLPNSTVAALIHKQWTRPIQLFSLVTSIQVLCNTVWTVAWLWSSL